MDDIRDASHTHTLCFRVDGLNEVAWFVAMGIQIERERCAKIAETWKFWCARYGYHSEEYASDDIAARIREGK